MFCIRTYVSTFLVDIYCIFFRTLKERGRDNWMYWRLWRHDDAHMVNEASTIIQKPISYCVLKVCVSLSCNTSTLCVRLLFCLFVLVFKIIVFSPLCFLLFSLVMKYICNLSVSTLHYTYIQVMFQARLITSIWFAKNCTLERKCSPFSLPTMIDDITVAVSIRNFYTVQYIDYTQSL